ncbi:hypothetical protein BABINDRAFT_6425 [Babjeviella inositovora NRRL Y-12698]|uniref:Pseudouridine synthase n=1 Tax=Babjeviella inositovora NRRL Y-12698 TaxID=984486 RepID=A0A1E3QW10_9ASCO|nr:uncharacterized protein BABINDRAFT_6425 [Babjeviella inositovora NRRL Y-12698]ODQ81774.1 hypothetical protein BABINDRAFT_6425 [Babjeviella inositovora NRRL Y-12698]
MTLNYIFENGMRKVLPHHVSREINVKGRWLGKTVVSILDSELAPNTQAYTRSLIDKGKISLIRGNVKSRKQPVQSVVYTDFESLSTIPIAQGDMFTNICHLHEPPIPLSPSETLSLDVVFEDEDLLIINKPSGVPVHPTGGYFYNTVTEIVKQQLELHNVFPVHRLDKLTSGVLILGKTSARATAFSKLIQEHSVDKTYFARVRGEFLDSEDFFVHQSAIFTTNNKYGFDRAAQEAETHFKRVTYNAKLDQSVVMCKPITGRMHQIRIHLKELGHPIVNDPIYGDETVENYGDRSKSMQSGKECEECGTKLYLDGDRDDMCLWLHSWRYVLVEKKAGEKELWVFETKVPEWANI